MTEAELSKLKCAELTAMCREKKLPYSGTKAALIARLLGKTPPAPTKRAVKPRVQPLTPSYRAPVFSLLRDNSDVIVLKKNERGLYVHNESKFIFDPNSKLVIGRVEGDTERALYTSDLAECETLRFGADLTRIIPRAAEGEDLETRYKKVVAEIIAGSGEECDEEDDQEEE